jgi:transcriptional regulator with XRE-family HTH domain
MTLASRLLSRARRVAALSQHTLAVRTGVTQASISRIEDGKTSPRVDTLDRLLEACGFTVELAPRLGEGIDRTAMRDLLRLSPVERARLAVEEARNLDRIGR